MRYVLGVMQTFVSQMLGLLVDVALGPLFLVEGFLPPTIWLPELWWSGDVSPAHLVATEPYGMAEELPSYEYWGGNSERQVWVGEWGEMPLAREIPQKSPVFFGHGGGLGSLLSEGHPRGVGNAGIGGGVEGLNVHLGIGAWRRV